MMMKDTIREVAAAVDLEAAEVVAVASEVETDPTLREAVEDKVEEMSNNIKTMMKMRVIITANKSITSLKEEATKRKIWHSMTITTLI